MEATPRLIHYFDPLLHRTACGAGFEHRSTKHARSVTCEACIAYLVARRADHAEPAPSDVGA